MRSPFLVAAAVCDLLLLLSAPALVAAQELSPLWFSPALTWYGIDGQWSSFTFQVGEPSQAVSLTVATTLSEFWMIESTGCVAAPICINARGGVIDIPSSKTWRSLGPWELGTNLTGMGGNGDYGLEDIAFANEKTGIATTVNGALVAGINDTNYFQGFVGLGVTRGKFGTNLTNPFISQLAETYGTIPSHSYGYTAGAHYRNSATHNGTVASLTLGGYDKLRFVPHNNVFSLVSIDQTTRLPGVRLRGVTANVKSLDEAPGNWTSTSQTLVAMNDSITAIIDTTTPYLWLPTPVCDRFAAALNLKWREDLGVYVFSKDEQFHRFQVDPDLTLTFSMSSYENTDNFGQPLSIAGVVNITVPAATFAQVLRYPFNNVIQWGDESIAYFPLKRSTPEGNGNKYIIGRAFMQEAYLITRYDSGTFSLHQALFPNNAPSNYSLEAIKRPDDSPFPAYVPQGTSQGLQPGQTAGIVLSAFACGSVIGVILWWCSRRRKRSKNKTEPTRENKEETQSIDGDSPRSPVKRMFSIMIGRKRSKKPVAAHEVHGSSSQPVEVGADAQHQVFEMPVPPEPVELDSHDVGDEDTELGVDSSQAVSEYELTRRKLERQLQGPVPTYSPTTTDHKTMQDASLMGHYRPAEDPSPVSSPTYANGSSLPDSLPSPLSPHPDWPARVFNFPSPMTITPPVHISLSAGSDPSSSCYSPVSPHSPHTFAPSSVSRSDSNSVSPTSPIGSVRLPSPTVQRTPIDPSRVICLGPLPENIQLPHQQPPTPRIITPNGRTVETGRSSLRPPGGSRSAGGLTHSRASRGSNDSLGSNFTVEEESRIRHEEVARQQSTRQRPVDDEFPRSPRSMERIEAGCELVHVPQVADKRYSWEEQDK